MINKLGEKVVRKVLLETILDKFDKNSEIEKKLDLILEKELAEAMAEKTPIGSLIEAQRVEKLISAYKDDPEYVKKLYSMFTSEGWQIFRSHLTAVKRFIERKLASSMHITDKEEFANRVEYEVYTKLLSKELLVRQRYKIILEQEANEKLLEKEKGNKRPSRRKPPKKK